MAIYEIETEDQWKTCQLPYVMVGLLADKALLNQHNARLFAVACLEDFLEIIPPGPYQDALGNLCSVANKFADGEVAQHELEIATQQALAAGETAPPSSNERFNEIKRLLGRLAERVGAKTDEHSLELAQYTNDVVAATAIIWRRYRHDLDPQHSPHDRGQRYLDIDDDIYRRQSNLIQDVFPNPFKPQTAMNPEWLTLTVVAMAEQVHDRNDLDAIGPLGDALQDAGCNDENMLSHCNSSNPHVKGNYTVQLVRKAAKRA